MENYNLPKQTSGGKGNQIVIDLLEARMKESEKERLERHSDWADPTLCEFHL